MAVENDGTLIIPGATEIGAEDNDNLEQDHGAGGEEDGGGRVDHIRKLSKFDQDELAEYGKKAKRRIAKAIYERDTERDAHTQTRARAAQLEEENITLRNKLNETEYAGRKTTVASTKQQLESELTALETEHAAAMEEGDSKKVSEIQRKMAVIGGKIGAIDAQAEELERTPPKKVERRPDTQGGPAPAARRWMDRNPWIGNQENQPMLNRVLDMQRALVAEGFEVSDELYEEMDRRLEVAYPSIAELRPNYRKGKKRDDLDPPNEDDELGEDTGTQARRQRGSQVRQASVDEGGDGGGTARPGQRLTNADMAKMRKANLDPNKPEHRIAWMNRNNTGRDLVMPRQ